jgi:hypothetical protein
VAKDYEQSKADKLYEKLIKRSYGALSQAEVEQLLSHALIKADVSPVRGSGSHSWAVKVSDPAIRQFWGVGMFNVVVHNGQVRKSYVDDIVKYIGFKKELENEA